VSRIVASVSTVATDYHAPLVIALPIIAAVVILKVVVSKRSGRPALRGKVVVRCNKGHVFETTWSALGSVTSIRLAATRVQRCRVGHHWALVKPVSDSELTDDERRQLTAQNLD
jgi:hypothetical protein